MTAAQIISSSWGSAVGVEGVRRVLGRPPAGELGAVESFDPPSGNARVNVVRPEAWGRAAAGDSTAASVAASATAMSFKAALRAKIM